MEVSGQPLYPQGKSHQYQLERRLGGPQSWSRFGGSSCWESYPGHPSHNLVTVLSYGIGEIFRARYWIDICLQYQLM